MSISDIDKHQFFIELGTPNFTKTHCLIGNFEDGYTDLYIGDEAQQPQLFETAKRTAVVLKSLFSNIQSEPRLINENTKSNLRSIEKIISSKLTSFQKNRINDIFEDINYSIKSILHPTPGQGLGSVFINLIQMASGILHSMGR